MVSGFWFLGQSPSQPLIDRAGRGVDAKYHSLEPETRNPKPETSLNNYSCRNAESGSTRDARRAGSQQAISATIVNKEAITAKVNGSVVVTP